METLEAIQQRRSVKYYDPQHVMTAAELEQLLSLAMLSPTAFNVQHWRFVNVQDIALRQQIRDLAWNQAQVTDASAFLLLCADLNAWEKQPERYWRNVDASVRDYVLPVLDGFYRGKAQLQRDEAIRSCGMAAQTLMLAAKAMGYDSCPMDGFDFAAVAELIQLPSDHIIVMALAIGKPLQPARPRAGQLSLAEVLITDRFAG